MTTPPPPPALQEGHAVLYRLTATGQDSPPETRYFLSAYEAAAWRDRLRATGYGAQVASVPSAAFSVVADGQLDRLAREEVDRMPR